MAVDQATQTTNSGERAGAAPDLRAPDLAATLGGITAAAVAALGADRATCYVHDAESDTVASVHSTERDPARRAYLERAIGKTAEQLPILRRLVASPEPVLVIEDLAGDPDLRIEISEALRAGALIGLRLEHRAADGAAPVLLGVLFCSYSRPTRFAPADRQAAQGLAALATLALANARLQSDTARALEENRALTAEQASLRQVATRVATEAPPEAVFGQAAAEVAHLLLAAIQPSLRRPTPPPPTEAPPEAVFGQAAAEVAHLLGVEEAIVVRFGEQGATVVGTYGAHSGLGDRLPTTGGGALAQVSRTGAAARISDYSALEPGSPLRAHALAHGYTASVAAPVSVAGRLWGALLATTKRAAGLPEDASERLSRFAELVALAIANAETRHRLIEQAANDPLTGLANHRTFYERLHANAERATRYGQPLSLVVIDLDHFKQVNDTFGHPVGDSVLKEVARRLGELARSVDTLARIGGEEFAWLLPETDAQAARSAAERARAAISMTPFEDVGRLTTSSGIAELTEAGGVKALVDAADAALYQAKSQGRNACVVHAPELDAAPSRGWAAPPLQLTSSVERLLSLAREQLGLTLAAVSEFESDRQTWRHLDGDGGSFGLRIGDSLLREEGYCQRVVDGRLTSLVRDARNDPRVNGLPVTQAAGIGAYLGVPITMPDGDVFGVLCCLSPTREPQLGEGDVRLLRMIAEMLGEEFGRQKRRSSAQREHRERILRVLEGTGLEIVLQPIVELGEGGVVAAEALSRFAEPGREVDAWFAEAAAVGLGVELELAAIAAALKRLPALPARARLSLNVSPAAVLTPGLATLLGPVPGERLSLELTEHEPVADYSALAAALDVHRARGVQLLIDDAGAGFASLRHVLGLRPDGIKLDLSLTRCIDTDPMRRALAAALVTFARQIDAIIIAEGVETAAEIETLRSLGVTHGQGYHIARPGHGPVPERVALTEGISFTPFAEGAQPSR